MVMVKARTAALKAMGKMEKSSRILANTTTYLR